MARILPFRSAAIVHPETDTQTDRDLITMVREAFELLTDAESNIDLRDWLKAARRTARIGRQR
jgi:hypothetical protein